MAMQATDGLRELKKLHVEHSQKVLIISKVLYLL